MSVRSDAPMPLLCELGWHRPEALARWNDGYYFSKCMRCGRDLVRTAYGQWQLPKGYRVVWQQKPPETRQEIALVPEGNGAVAVAEQVLAEAPADAADEVVDAPTIVVPATMFATEPAVADAPSERDEDVSAPPQVIKMAEAEQVPPPPESVAASEERAETRVSAFEEDPEEPLLPLNGSPGSVTVEQAEALPADHFPIEDLLQQLNGTGGHEVHEASTHLVEAATAAPEQEREELPIEEVLRHLHATALPPTPVAEESAETLAPSADGEAAAEEESAVIPPIGDEESTEAEAEPVASTPLEEAVETDTIEGSGFDPDLAPEAAQAEAVSESEKEADPAVAHEDIAEPLPDLAGEANLVPASAPAPAAPSRPVPAYSSDWDFMEEDEEDSISSFWEETERPPASDTPVAEAVPPDQEREEPAAVEASAEEPLRQSLAPAAASTAEDVTADHDEHLPAVAVVEPEPEPEAAERVEPGPEREPVPVMPVAFSEPLAAAEPQPDAAPEPQTDPAEQLEDTVPVFRPLEPVDAIDTAEPPTDPIETPPWVDQSGHNLEEEEAPPPRKSFVIIAVLTGIVIAVVAIIANQPSRAPAPAPVAATAPRAPAPVAAPKQEAKTVVRAAPAPARAVPLPALPARGGAFVTASVLQCRSAPVERSAPVRKLVRGAEVQILAREGAWLSVAHKGRQCWAAARFISSAEPW